MHYFDKSLYFGYTSRLCVRIVLIINIDHFPNILDQLVLEWRDSTFSVISTEFQMLLR